MDFCRDGLLSPALREIRVYLNQARENGKHHVQIDDLQQGKIFVSLLLFFYTSSSSSSSSLRVFERDREIKIP